MFCNTNNIFHARREGNVNGCIHLRKSTLSSVPRNAGLLATAHDQFWTGLKGLLRPYKGLRLFGMFIPIERIRSLQKIINVYNLGEVKES